MRQHDSVTFSSTNTIRKERKKTQINATQNLIKLIILYIKKFG